MGEIREEGDESPDEVAALLASQAEQHAGGAGSVVARKWRESGPFPPSAAGTPLILDTDIGGDPDDAIAVAVAAVSVPELALVVTCDEVGGRRARFARVLLDACGRPEVPVVAGSSLPAPGPFVVGSLVSDAVPPPTGVDHLEVLDRFCASVAGRVRWVGLGPMTNLAGLLARSPGLADRLQVTLMGGAINYRDPERAEHNVRLDVAAARAVLAATRQPDWVMSDVTFTPKIEVTAGHPLYAWLAEPSAPRWAQLLRAHLDVWFARHHEGSMQHDPLTLSAALQLPFVDFRRERVVMEDDGRMFLRDDGYDVNLSYQVRYGAFVEWLARCLTAAARR